MNVPYHHLDVFVVKSMDVNVLRKTWDWTVRYKKTVPQNQKN